MERRTQRWQAWPVCTSSQLPQQTRDDSYIHAVGEMNAYLKSFTKIYPDENLNGVLDFNKDRKD